MISLGVHDRDLKPGALEAFLETVEKLSGDSREKPLRGDKGPVALEPLAEREAMTVSEVQTALRELGFLTDRVDGICGYRTQAGIRLFQEYIRSIEGKKCTPDGIAGPRTEAHLRRWSDAGSKANWMPLLEAWNDGSLAGRTCEFNDWLALLEGVKAHYRAKPTALLRHVNAYQKETDTRRVEDWDFSPLDLHLVGIRYGERDANRKFDDIMVLLVKGMVFKFQGSTDPGSTKNPKGAPFLVQGQHDFRFGAHRNQYHALRPLHHGVLVVRSKGDLVLDAEDLEGELERNGTINIHWAGKGVGRPVNRWSEGCQVITGSGYENHENRLVSCSSYVAVNNTEVSTRGKSKTRGAYNVMADLLVALSADMRNPGRVEYTLLHESDLALDARIASLVSKTRSEARQFMRKLA